MSSEPNDQPQNRKQRRAASKKSGLPIQPPTTSPTLKLAQPDRSGPKSKTLLDLYEDKKSLLEHGQPFSPVHTDGQIRDETGNVLLNAGLRSSPDDDDEDFEVGKLGQAFFWSVTLAMLHFMLDVLVYQQYRQDLEWGAIWGRSALAVPLLFVLVYMMRSETVGKLGIVKDGVYFVVAVVGGCYVIHVANRYGYYAVMQQTPALGTLWIWSVIEMNVWFAAASVAVDAAYLFWKGYSIT